MIYLEPIKVKWEPGKQFLKGSSRREISDFEDFCAQEYVEQVRRRVALQIGKAKWSPLSAAWLRRKEKMGWSLKFWIATGQLMNELKVKSRRVVGFDNRKVHKVSHTKLLVIARANEYGTFSIPARPLFRPVYWYMRKHIDRVYRDYLESRS